MGGDLIGEASIRVLAVVGVHPAVLDLAAGGGGVALLADVVLVVFAGVARLTRVDVVADANMISNLYKL